MRTAFAAVLLLFFAAATTVRAEDPPEGSIGVQVKIDEGKIVVVEPLKGSPAEKAGIKSGDVILKINDYKVKDTVEPDDLQEAVKEIVKHKPGTKIKLTVKRDDKDMTIEVTVGKRSEIFPPKDKE
jgi:C-terminal processing protease CtpA/Prc